MRQTVKEEKVGWQMADVPVKEKKKKSVKRDGVQNYDSIFQTKKSSLGWEEGLKSKSGTDRLVCEYWNNCLKNSTGLKLNHPPTRFQPKLHIISFSTVRFMIQLPFGNHCKQRYVEPAVISAKFQSQSATTRQCGMVRHTLLFSLSHANRFSFRKTSTHITCFQLFNWMEGLLSNDHQQEDKRHSSSL